jgi:hypothetical protein
MQPNKYLENILLKSFSANKDSYIAPKVIGELIEKEGYNVD